MRLTIPLTGTVSREGQVHGDGLLSGDPNDPIQPIRLALGNVAWTMVDIDMEEEVMIIEVTPGDVVGEPTGQLDGNGEPILESRKATQLEKQGFLQHAQHEVESHTKEELYALSNCPKLKRPFKVKQ